jgi:ABC-type Fe3+ transport system substrate-binding protein
MRKVLILVSGLMASLSLVLSVVVTTATELPKAGWDEKWDKTVEAARKEGQLLIFLNAPAEARVAIVDAIKQKFGIETDVTLGAGASLGSRFNSEYRAGVYQVDCLAPGASTLFSSVKPAGFLQPIEPHLILPEVKDPQKWINGKLPFYDADKQVVAYVSQVIPPLVYNPNMVKSGELTSQLDLLQPQWKGKIVMFDPSVTGAGLSWMTQLGIIWGVDKAKGYLSTLLREQEAVVTRDMRQQVEWVARGKYPVALWSQTPAVIQFLKSGASLVAAEVKEPKLLSPANGGIGIPTKPAHPNAATVFLNWYLSKEGQALVVKNLGAPSSRVDVAPEGIDPMFFLKPGDKFTFQEEEFAIAQTKWNDEWTKIVASGGK